MSYVQYSETWPFIHSPVSPSIPRMFGLAVLQNGWNKDNTNVLRCFPIWRTWRWAWSLGEIRSWNISELLPDGGVRAHLLKWKKKKKKQCKTSSPVPYTEQRRVEQSRAEEDGGTAGAPLIPHVVTNGGWFHVLWRRDGKAESSSRPRKQSESGLRSGDTKTNAEQQVLFSE